MLNSGKRTRSLKFNVKDGYAGVFFSKMNRDKSPSK
jgi:hypothetical protein